MVREKDRVRRLLGYLPQEFGVYPRITAETLLRHFAVLKGIERRQVDEVVEGLLHKTNLWDVRKRRLGTYSGGMKQRFGIAQALIGDPRLIIVDEPTAGLDPGERLRFLNLLSEIGENVVVILSTHIVEDVADLCRRMAVISHGRVLLQGEPAAALESLHGKVWSRAVERAELQVLERDLDVISTHLLGGRTVVHVYASERPAPGFEPVDAGLEDVYFSTLKHAGAASERRAAVMFGEIFRFELRYQLRQPIFWIGCAVFFLLAFLATTTDAVVIGGRRDRSTATPPGS